ncbi:MAG: pilin [Patescibacteria group bacterium]
MYLAQHFSDVTGKEAATIKDLEVVFGNLVTVIMALAGIVLFILLISGGFRYLTAGGDPKAVEAAQKTLTYAIIGIVVVACAFLILRLIENFTGVPVTLFKVTL